MKIKSTICLFAVIFLCGCTLIGQMDVYQEIRKQFPNGEIVRLPSNLSNYIIRSSNEIWYAEYDGNGSIQGLRLVKILSLSQTNSISDKPE